MSTLTEIIIAVFVAAGIPSAVFVAMFNRWMRKQQELEDARVQAQILLFRGDRANCTLAEECAVSIQKLDPQGKTHNGRLAGALEYARKVKHEQQDFITAEGAKRHGRHG